MEKFKRERDSKWLEWVSMLRSYRAGWDRFSYQEVELFLLFIGYPRSGHTLIGAVLDAHPEVILSHELDALAYLERGLSARRVFRMIQNNSLRFNRKGREWMSYNYQVPGQWQGKNTTIRIIGDKSGGITNRRLQHPEGRNLLRTAEEKIGRKPVFLHVIRNPYDIISTMTRRTGKRREEEDLGAFFPRKIHHFFQHAAGVAKLKAEGRYRVIDVYHEDFVCEPGPILAGLCTQLGLDAPENYLADCAAIVWDKPARSRTTFSHWTAESVADVAREMKAYPWFDRYQFTEPPPDA